MYQLQLAEIAANSQKLDFTDQIKACDELAVAAGQATAMLGVCLLYTSLYVCLTEKKVRMSTIYGVKEN